jgi:hypothetical protein
MADDDGNYYYYDEANGELLSPSQVQQYVQGSGGKRLPQSYYYASPPRTPQSIRLSGGSLPLSPPRRRSWAGREGVSKLLIRKIVKGLGVFRISNGAKDELIRQCIQYVDAVVDTVVRATAAIDGDNFERIQDEDVAGAIVAYEGRL